MVDRSVVEFMETHRDVFFLCSMEKIQHVPSEDVSLTSCPGWKRRWGKQFIRFERAVVFTRLPSREGLLGKVSGYLRACYPFLSL